MKLTNFLATRTGAAPAREAADSTISTLLGNLKRDAETAFRPQPDLTPAQRELQAHRNALFVSDHLVAGECPQTFADLWAAFRADFGPTGAIEEELVRHLTAAALGIRRIDRIEGRMWQAHQRLGQREFGPERKFDTHYSVSVLLSRTCHNLTPDQVARLDGYRKMYDRRWAAALKQLTQYRRATGRKAAVLPPHMEFVAKAEHLPMPGLAINPIEEPCPNPEPTAAAAS